MNKQKYLVKLIKQAAGEMPDDAPGAPVASAPGTVAGPPSPARTVAPSGVPQVKAMQQSLIQLAQSVTAQISVQNVGSENQQEAGEAQSRDSFNNFLTKHFMRASDVPGKEFDPDPTKTQMGQKTPTAPNRMGTVMDTMSRIGNPKTGEMATDGKWGPRTNNALHNAYAFAFSMLKLAASFQPQVTAYNDRALAEFKTLIPPDEEVNPVIKLDAGAIEKATIITKHLKAIQAMYEEIKENVLEAPQYKTYIEGDTPFTSYKKSGPDFTQQEKQMFDQLSSGNAQFNRDIPFRVTSQDGKASMEGHISISDLVSSDTFKKWYYSPNNTVREDPSLIFNAIRQALQQAGQVGGV